MLPPPFCAGASSADGCVAAETSATAKGAEPPAALAALAPGAAAESAAAASAGAESSAAERSAGPRAARVRFAPARLPAVLLASPFQDGVRGGFVAPAASAAEAPARPDRLDLILYVAVAVAVAVRQSGGRSPARAAEELVGPCWAPAPAAPTPARLEDLASSNASPKLCSSDGGGPETIALGTGPTAGPRVTLAAPRPDILVSSKDVCRAGRTCR